MKKVDYKLCSSQMEDCGDTNGCTVIALAQLLNIDYHAANKIAINKYGRDWKRGMYTGIMLQMYKMELAKIGKKLVKLDTKEILAKVDRHNYRVKTLTSNNIKMANLMGRCVVLTRSHVAILENNQMSDWTVNKASHVQSVYQVQGV